VTDHRLFIRTIVRHSDFITRVRGVERERGRGRGRGRREWGSGEVGEVGRGGEE